IYYSELLNLFEFEGALAHLQDDADILVRAQGPAVVNSPVLSDINWLFGAIQQQFKGLVAASSSAKSAHALMLAEQIPVHLTGIAPGSFYAGFKLDSRKGDTQQDLLEAAHEEDIVEEAREALTGLTIVPEMVTGLALSR